MQKKEAKMESLEIFLEKSFQVILQKLQKVPTRKRENEIKKKGNQKLHFDPRNGFRPRFVDNFKGVCASTGLVGADKTSIWGLAVSRLPANCHFSLHFCMFSFAFAFAAIFVVLLKTEKWLAEFVIFECEKQIHWQRNKPKKSLNEIKLKFMDWEKKLKLEFRAEREEKKGLRNKEIDGKEVMQCKWVRNRLPISLNVARDICLKQKISRNVPGCV